MNTEQLSGEVISVNDEDERILSCGHKPSSHSEGTTGTARWNDNGVYKEICWDCSNNMQIEELKEANKYFAYISEDGQSIQTWTGKILMTIMHMYPLNNYWTKRGFTSDDLYYIRAMDIHGQHWYGTGMGKNMYCRMRKYKNQNKRRK